MMTIGHRDEGSGKCLFLCNKPNSLDYPLRRLGSLVLLGDLNLTMLILTTMEKLEEQ